MTQARSIDPKFRALKNNEVTTIAKGRVVVLDTTEDDACLLGAAATDTLYGIVANDIAAGAFGDIAIGGVVPVLAGGNITRGAYLTSDGAGALIVTTSDQHSYIAIARGAGGSGDLVEAEIVTPGAERSTA